MSETTTQPDTTPRKPGSGAKRSSASKHFIAKRNGHNTLTTKQKIFIERVMAGDTQVDAYRAAYDCSAMANPTIYRHSSMLMLNEKVRTEIEKLRSEQDQQRSVVAKLNREWVLERLMKNARLSLGEEPAKVKRLVRGEVVEVETHVIDQSAANRALELLGKELRMFRDQIEIGGVGEFDTMTTAELRRVVIEEAAIVMRDGVPTVELIENKTEDKEGCGDKAGTTAGK